MVWETARVVIRIGRCADADAVIGFWADFAGPTRLPSDVAAVTGLLEHDPEALLVAEDDGRIVGTLVVGWDGWRCHLYRLAVEPGWRRRGVASQLVSVAREHARALGARRLDAQVDDDNELGRAFWSGVGFGVSDRDRDRRWTRPT